MAQARSTDRLLNGGHGGSQTPTTPLMQELEKLADAIGKSGSQNVWLRDYHGDPLLAETRIARTTFKQDFRHIITDPATWKLVWMLIKSGGKGVSIKDGAGIIAGVSEYGPIRKAVLQGFNFLGRHIRGQVEAKWGAMLHPPLSYLGDAFQHRQVDGTFNSVLHPHLGQAGSPYAKTVPAKASLLGAQPDPGDIFDRLMAREPRNPRVSQSGLSVMLIYHAVILIHDIFRTSETDKNISDSSSYLDLSPLYGFNEATNRQVRTSKLGLLKPDTFAENRLLRQPPGVCTMLVMYNRYHNYCARQLYKINENGRFQVPDQYSTDAKTALQRYKDYYYELEDFAVRYRRSARQSQEQQDTDEFKNELTRRKGLQHDAWIKEEYIAYQQGLIKAKYKKLIGAAQDDPEQVQEYIADRIKDLGKFMKNLKNTDIVNVRKEMNDVQDRFKRAWNAAWVKLDDDLYNTARLITCGLYANISVHDYLRALMGFHQFNSTFTLDPRLEIDKRDGKEGLPRGIGNQVSVEFNLLYRFHCAIGVKDEEWTNNFIRSAYGPLLVELQEARDERGNIIKSIDELHNWDPATLSSSQFTTASKLLAAKMAADPTQPQLPSETRFYDMDNKKLDRDPITGQFDDQKLVDILTTNMEEPICQFGPRNIPRALKAIEVAGILQARKWEVGTLNDFREFFGLGRHKTFMEINRDPEIQQALSDLYENVDKVEFYPGVFCEGGGLKNPLDLDPGPQLIDSTLWSAIFFDAVTLVRSDRFYTVDWNTNSLTSWGMKQVTPDSDTLKSSVFHRLIQRAFPDWWKDNNIHYFHPFYTTEANMKYAQQQGYGPLFDLPEFKPTDSNQVKKVLPVVRNAAKPRRPNNTYVLSKGLKRTKHMTENVTIVVTDVLTARQVLGTRLEAFSNPAWLDTWATPKEILSVLKARTGHQESDLLIPDAEQQDKICRYFRYWTKYTLEIQSSIFVRGKTALDNVFQIDAVRDLAIPVVTRYFADFLGFGHLILNSNKKQGKFSENEIYNHITNVQTYLAYNVDETRKLKRRAAFKKSLEFLLSSTRDQGHIRAVRSWWPSWLTWNKYHENKDSEYVGALGYKVAEKLVKHKSIKNDTEAAAVLLLVALDAAFNAVLAFTTTLKFMFDETRRTHEYKTRTEAEQSFQEQLRELIKEEHIQRQQNASKNSGSKPVKLHHLTALNEEQRSKLSISPGMVSWFDLQEIAFDGERSEAQKDDELMHYVLEAQRLKVKLPLVRKVVAKEVTLDTSEFVFKKGDSVIVDVHACEALNNPLCQGLFCKEKIHLETGLHSYLAYSGGFSHDAVSFEKYIPIVGVGAMFSLLSCMRNLRQGHDAQGRLKEIDNNPSFRNLKDYCDPDDVTKYIKAYQEKENDTSSSTAVWESFDTKPDSTTYLTPEWDETIPFPNSLKVRFDGFGEGVWLYGDNSDQSHGIMSLYEPQGPSHTGGTWSLNQWKEGDKKVEAHLAVHEALMKSLGTPYSGCGM